MYSAILSKFKYLLLLTILISIITPFFKIIAPGAVMVFGIADRRVSGKIAIAGPLTNIVISIASTVVALLSSGIVSRVAGFTAWINAFIAFFNLIPFGALDGEPTHIFVGMVAPPYDDRLYLRVYRTLGPLLQDPNWRRELMEAENEHQVLRLMELVRR